VCVRAPGALVVLYRFPRTRQLIHFFGNLTSILFVGGLFPQGHFLFASLYSDHLAELVSAMELKECNGGEDVLKQGSPLEHFYVVAGR